MIVDGKDLTKKYKGKIKFGQQTIQPRQVNTYTEWLDHNADPTRSWFPETRFFEVQIEMIVSGSTKTEAELRISEVVNDFVTGSMIRLDNVDINISAEVTGVEKEFIKRWDYKVTITMQGWEKSSNSISTGDGTIYIYRPDVRHGYSSEDIFNLLTNNGNIQGMYMTDGKLYWNGTYIKSKSITTAALAADSVTAEKIKVDDLYSLKASIAGFKISSDTISHQSITNPESGIGQNYYDTFFSSKDKRLTFRKGPGTSDYITFDIRGLRASGGKRLNLISDAETNDSSEGFSSGAHHSMGHTNIYGNLYVADSFRTAGTKQAVRQTENYGEKGVYCYETPTPHFGDIGSGEISEDGKCYIDIEDILKEMINTEMQYYVFLQKCGEGDLYVSECFPDYFIVTGTPGLRFFWELKAKQKGYEYNRYEGEDRVVGFRKIAYDEEYIAETEKLIEEREEI